MYFVFHCTYLKMESEGRPASSWCKTPALCPLRRSNRCPSPREHRLRLGTQRIESRAAQKLEKPLEFHLFSLFLPLFPTFPRCSTLISLDFIGVHPISKALGHAPRSRRHQRPPQSAGCASDPSETAPKASPRLEKTAEISSRGSVATRTHRLAK